MANPFGLQFYVEALVDAFHALKVANGPACAGPWGEIRSLLPRGLQDIITFLVRHCIAFLINQL